MFEYVDKGNAHELAVLLLPGFSLSEVALLVDAVEEVNRVSGHTLYKLTLLSVDGAPVASRQGRSMAVDGALSPESSFGLLVVSVAIEPKVLTPHDPVVATLARIGRKSPVGGFNAGAFWLAAAGLLNGCRATVHWSMLEQFSERYPAVIASSNLFEIDKDRVTCGGGCAAIDLFLYFVARQHGNDLTAVVAENLLIDRIRGREDRQRIPLRNRIGANQPKLVQAVMLMEANLEEPLTTDELASHVCVSRRQLERLFKQHLDKVPSQYYLEIRLNRARQMLRQSSKSIIQIGLSCGFSSGPHFSSAYRNHFNMTPREDRQSAVRKIE